MGCDEGMEGRHAFVVVVDVRDTFLAFVYLRPSREEEAEDVGVMPWDFIDRLVSPS